MMMVYINGLMPMVIDKIFHLVIGKRMPQVLEEEKN